MFYRVIDILIFLVEYTVVRNEDKNIKELRIIYTNWRGETAERVILPISIWFGSTQWHPTQQWLLKAHDVEKDAERDFALLDIKNFSEKIRNDISKLKPQISSAKLYADGGSRGNPGHSAGGFVVLDMEDNVLLENGKYLGIRTNNQAEYHSLKGGMEAAIQMGVSELDVFMDSLLVVNQMKGIYKIRNIDLAAIHEAIKLLIPEFKKVTFTHVPRALNKLADAQVNKVLDERMGTVHKV